MIIPSHTFCLSDLDKNTSSVVAPELQEAAALLVHWFVVNFALVFFVLLVAGLALVFSVLLCIRGTALASNALKTA